MAKISIKFNNKDYLIDESQVTIAVDSVQTHLRDNLNGSGATIDFKNTCYNIDADKLTIAKNKFIEHIGTLQGSDSVLQIDGADYSVSNTKLQPASLDLKQAFDQLAESVDVGTLYISTNGIPALGVEQAGFILREDGSFDTIVVGDAATLFGEDKSCTACVVGSGTYTLEGDVLSLTTNLFDNVVTFSGTYSEDKSAIDFPELGITGVTDLDNIYVDGNNVYYYNDELGGYVGTLANKSIPTPVVEQTVNGYPVVALDTGAYVECSWLNTLIYPSSIIEIGYQACAWCENLEQIGAGDALRIIQDKAFFCCSKLKRVNIGPNVEYIGSQAFDGCSSLINIHFMGTIEQWNQISKGADWARDIAATHVQCTDGQVAL